MTTRTIVKSVMFNYFRLFSSITPGPLPPIAVKYNEITNHTINKLLKRQVSITQGKLNKLLTIKRVVFDLPLTLFGLCEFPSCPYYTLVGPPSTRGLKTGIYIYTHIKSGS